MNDPGSLQNLNDIVVPGPVAWWPLAPGWYLLLAVLLAGLMVLAVRWWLRWRRNRYRRQALAELASIRDLPGAQGFVQIPALLKRTALSVWPREEVASLTGASWHRFLDDSARMNRFSGQLGEQLDQLAYSRGNESLPSAEELEQVFDAAGFWLKNHGAPGRGD